MKVFDPNAGGHLDRDELKVRIEVAMERVQHSLLHSFDDETARYLNENSYNELLSLWADIDESVL